MNKEIIKLFAKYNKSVNEKMNAIIKTLSPEEWEKPLGGYFSSVRGMCSHLYISDFNWLKRFKNFRTFAALNDPFFDRENYAFKDVLFENKDEYFVKRPDLDNRLLAFTAEITGADIEGILKYTDSHGVTYERNFGGCVLQFLNHETHHRGMISVYLEMLGRENDFSSLAQVL
jgi:uncharacterized damage-inducible protein DinB